MAEDYEVADYEDEEVLPEADVNVAAGEAESKRK